MVAMDYGGKPDKHGGLLFGVRKYFSPREFTDRIITDFSITFEIAMGSGASGMYHTLRNSFPVEVGHLFDKLVIF